MAMSRSRGSSSVTSTSPIEIVPSVISSRPAIIRKSVDLPQPEGPTSTMNSPSSTARLTSSTATTPPENALVTFSSSIPAIALVARLHRPHHVHLGLEGHVPRVHREHRARDGRGLVACEEDDERGDLLRRRDRKDVQAA